jgi:hypothetical protein
VEPLAGTRRSPQPSRSLDQFYVNVKKALRAGPCVVLLDSFDAIAPKADLDAVNKALADAADGKKAEGSYGTGKAKMNSSQLGEVCDLLREHGSVLIGISQTRQNIGFGSQYNPKTYSGGEAIRFYCRLQLWTSIRENLQKKVLGKERHIGIVSQIKLTKNHLCGWQGKLELPILKGYGVDDLGSCVDYLVEEGVWQGKVEKKGSREKLHVTAPQFGVEGSREGVIRAVREMDLQGDLRRLVAERWAAVEEASRVDRDRRYG